MFEKWSASDESRNLVSWTRSQQGDQFIVCVSGPLQLPPGSGFGDSMLTALYVTGEMDNQDPIWLWKVLS